MMANKVWRKWLMRLGPQKASPLLNEAEDGPCQKSEHRKLREEHYELGKPANEKPQAARNREVGMKDRDH
jgi:hypothetical protein